MRLNAGRLKRIIELYYDRLGEHREALNRLNVYPVPDGDTGTNMRLTVGSVIDAIGDAESMAEVSQAIAHGSLMGARGNSGVILSQILRGLSDTFRSRSDVGSADLVEALDLASEAAYQAVLRPVEGTILTVLRAAAEAAADADPAAEEDLSTLLERVYERAELALEQTPELLPVLKQAGVVDAGGAGLLLLIGAFLEEVTGTDVVFPDRLFVDAVAAGADKQREESDLRYEVMFFLEAESVDGFRDGWGELGDSIVVVGGDGMWNCHIHTNHIGAAIEAGIDVGRVRDIRVTDLLDQVGESAFHTPGFEPISEYFNAPVAVVPVAAGDGIAELFRTNGASGIVQGGQTMNPSTADLLEVVEALPAGTVILLPNNKNIIPVADQVDAHSTKRVHVVPTRSVPQGLAAMVSFMPNAPDIDALVARMRAAADSVITGEVTRAVRNAVVDFGEIRKDDWFGLADGEITSASESLAQALVGLLEHLVDPERELVTLITGEGALEEATEAAVRWIAEQRPDVEIEVVVGGQPLYPYYLSVE
ncbi:MAG TPA: DAK2 domain-containing protein [Acidimicrobiia bacterium]|nr:DAK2 domain-containing protein [Acidimicrobiia bacterium]